jgi:hypothetical protein
MVMPTGNEIPDGNVIAMLADGNGIGNEGSGTEIPPTPEIETPIPGGVDGSVMSGGAAPSPVPALQISLNQLSVTVRTADGKEAGQVVTQLVTVTGEQPLTVP